MYRWSVAGLEALGLMGGLSVAFGSVLVFTASGSWLTAGVLLGIGVLLPAVSVAEKRPLGSARVGGGEEGPWDFSGVHEAGSSRVVLPFLGWSGMSLFFTGAATVVLIEELML